MKFYVRNRAKIFGKPPYIYFVTDMEFIKIGITKKLASRMSSLQTGNPKKLHLIGAATGSKKYEKEQHKMWEGKSANGEWFKIDPRTAEMEVKKLSYKLPIFGFKNLLDEYVSCSTDIKQSRNGKVEIKEMSSLIRDFSNFIFSKEETRKMSEECGLRYDKHYIYGLTHIDYKLPHRFDDNSPYKRQFNDYVADWDGDDDIDWEDEFSEPPESES